MDFALILARESRRLLYSNLPTSRAAQIASFAEVGSDKDTLSVYAIGGGIQLWPRLRFQTQKSLPPKHPPLFKHTSCLSSSSSTHPQNIQASLSIAEGLGDEIQCTYDGESGFSFVFLTVGDLILCGLYKPPQIYAPK